MREDKLEFVNHGAYVYFIRPKPSKDIQGMGVCLAVASSEEQAWVYAMKDSGINKKDYYIDDIFLSYSEQGYGVLW